VLAPPRGVWHWQHDAEILLARRAGRQGFWIPDAGKTKLVNGFSVLRTEVPLKSLNGNIVHCKVQFPASSIQFQHPVSRIQHPVPVPASAFFLSLPHFK
jgi:hypothetical protein